jgi:hypothetical protein
MMVDGAGSHNPSEACGSAAYLNLFTLYAAGGSKTHTFFPGKSSIEIKRSINQKSTPFKHFGWDG